MRCLVVNQFEDARPATAGQRHMPGTFLELDEATAQRWTEQQLVKPIGWEGGPEWPWEAGGRAFDVPPTPRTIPRRVVACLSLWNDAAAMVQTASSWLPLVDEVVVVDGAYQGVPGGTAHSSDRALRELAQLCDQFGIGVEFTVAPPGLWPDQIAKRTAYLQHPSLRLGDLLFVVDADEFIVESAHDVLRTFTGEVGWVRMTYEHGYRRSYDQPRLFRWQPGLHYYGRHHWVWCRTEGPEVRRLVSTHQYGGPGWDHRLVRLRMRNLPDEYRSVERKAARLVHRMAQARMEAPMRALSEGSDGQGGARETLRVLHLSQIDPGLVIYRLHSALNETTPHASAFGCMADDNPFAGPRQFELLADREGLRIAGTEADVVHCHVDYHALDVLGLASRPRVGTVIHHHGTRYREQHDHWNTLDLQRAGLRLVSNLELLRYGPGLWFLPNPVPAARYLALARRLLRHPRSGQRSSLLVAHSPSKRELKGTAEFLEACDHLRRRGLPIEPVLIEGKSHAEAIELKAACDVTFDSAWLGMQCSGIEAAAMGQPVLAGGDQQLLAEARAYYGRVPWTVVEEGPGLVASLERELAKLWEDQEYYAREAERVHRVVVEHHDAAAVALRYLDLLDLAFGWRHLLTIGDAPLPANRL